MHNFWTQNYNGISLPFCCIGLHEEWERMQKKLIFSSFLKLVVEVFMFNFKILKRSLYSYLLWCEYNTWYLYYIYNWKREVNNFLALEINHFLSKVLFSSIVGYMRTINDAEIVLFWNTYIQWGIDKLKLFSYPSPYFLPLTTIFLIHFTPVSFCTPNYLYL